jgi:hypothetical protein
MRRPSGEGRLTRRRALESCARGPPGRAGTELVRSSGHASGHASGSLTSGLTEVRHLQRCCQADAGTRTPDPFITSEVLYQLSYVGVLALQCGFGQQWLELVRPDGTSMEQTRSKTLCIAPRMVPARQRREKGRASVGDASVPFGSVRLGRRALLADGCVVATTQPSLSSIGAGLGEANHRVHELEQFGGVRRNR